MKPLLVLPIAIPLLAAALCLLAWNHRRIQRALAVAASFALLGVGIALLRQVGQHGIQAVQIGNWPAPFGITLVADTFSALMVVMNGVMGAAVAVYSLYSIDRQREHYGYYAFYNVLLMGVSGAFLTGDVFNLYVWFEVMLMASFVLMALGGERAQLEGGLKYVTLNLISSAVFLSGVGILYGAMGTLNMADLSLQLREHISPGLATTLAMLFLVAFGIKAGAFPLFFWLPASYHTPPVAVTSIFAGLLTKVGAYALIRVFTLLFTQEVHVTHALLLVIAGFTMVTGVLGAAAQNEFRRILAFHIISQIGYIIMGLGLYTVTGVAGAIYFLVHNILSKTNLFLISGVAYKLRGTYQLKKLGGLYKERPLLATCFVISAMSLAGLPPLSGFIGKFVLVLGGLEKGAWTIVGVSLVVSILTLYSMTKIWARAFWKDAPEHAEPHEPAPESQIRVMMAPVAVLALLIIVAGVGAEYFVGIAMRAAGELMDPSGYIEAVLGERP